MDLLVALLPALLMVTLVIITRKVLMSLSLGLILAALIYESFNPWRTIVYLWNSLFGILTSLDWYLPILGFVILIGGITAVIALAGGIAFATGTSWGAFGILLPIAIPIAVQTNPEFMPVIIAAVLGGAVFGDHSSPVSDTTVLSATGARSTLHAHFISQLPYALVTAGIAGFGYLTFAIFQMVWPSYIIMAILFVVFVRIFKTVETENVEHDGEEAAA